MNNQIQIFTNSQFGEIRTMIDEKTHEPWFLAKDLCNILGHTNSRRALSLHVDEGDVTKCYTPTVSGKQLMTYVNESGLYSLMILSKLPQAKQFKRWVTSEVLPSIRKRGVYMTDEVAKRVIDNPTMLVDLAKDIREEHRLRVKAEKELLESKLVVAEQSEKILDLSNHVDALKGKVAALKPKADYYDIIKGADDLLCVSQIAAEYGKGGAEFNILLAEHGLQQKRTAGGQWLLHKEDLGKGYTGYATYWSKKKQKYCTSSLTKWTQSGKEHIYIVLKSHGILPLAEQPRQLTLFDNIQ